MDLNGVCVFAVAFEEDPHVHGGGDYLSAAPVHVVPEEAYSSGGGADQGVHGGRMVLLSYIIGE